jgi:hypothetical protein
MRSWALLVVLIGACAQNPPLGPDPVPEVPPAPEVPPVPQPPPPPAETPASPSSYETMCRHYCQTLDDTNFFICLGQHGAVEACRTQAAHTTERCYDDRCLPHLVSHDLCQTQCEVVSGLYGSYCQGQPAGEVCPDPPQQHLADCRRGCQ